MQARECMEGDASEHHLERLKEKEEAPVWSRWPAYMSRNTSEWIEAHTEGGLGA